MKLFNKIFLLGALCLALGSCIDEEVETIHANTGLVVKLALPDDKTVDINTRSISGNAINDILVVMLKDDKVKYQSFSNLSTLSFTITDFTPKMGDAVYVFCNTGKTSVNANTNTEDELLEDLTASNNTADLMYSKSTSIYNGGPNEIKLEHSLAKVCLYSDESGLNIANWKICNLPDKGFMSAKEGYPTGAMVTNIVEAGTDSCVYIVPRKDNNTVTPKTYLLLQLKDKGWYRLDFCDGSHELDFTATPTFMNIERNYRYRFNILSVKNDGYQTEQQAASNPGSNIIYRMEIVNSSSISNGQYSLLTSNDKIELPSLNYPDALPVVDVSVKVPDALKSTMSGPYSVTLHNPKGGLRLWIGATSGDEINLLDIAGSDISQKITLSLSIIDNVNLKDTYIEIRLGNLVKQIPISLQTANCYIHNFQEGKDLLIPVAHANKKQMRIDLDDKTNSLAAEILWSDRSMDFADITAEYEPDLKSIRVHKKNPGSFIGNFVVAIKSGTTIKWSWHVWCMDDTSVQYNNKTARYELKNTQTHGNTEWMDRNLGATSVAKNDIYSVGLLYQWGRKDPFPGSSEFGESTERTLYHKSGSFTLQTNHPVYGENIVTANNNNNIEYAIENPTKFIKGNDYSWNVEGVDLTNTINGNWVTNAYNKEFLYLWTTVEGDKEVYDPCPIGWRVAHSGKTGPWISFRIIEMTDPNGGFSWGDIYYPWGSYRDVQGHLESSLKQTALWWGSIPTLNQNMNSTRFSIKYNVEYVIYSPSAQAIAIRCVKDDSKL